MKVVLIQTPWSGASHRSFKKVTRKYALYPPLGLMYRHAREARIYDGPDEVHVSSLARRILKRYAADGGGIDFGRDA